MSATSHDRLRYATPTRVDVTECRTNPRVLSMELDFEIE